jgi:hypothetical protein
MHKTLQLPTEQCDERKYVYTLSDRSHSLTHGACVSQAVRLSNLLPCPEANPSHRHVISREPLRKVKLVVFRIVDPGVRQQLGRAEPLCRILVQTRGNKRTKFGRKRSGIQLRWWLVDDSLHHFKVDRHARVGKHAQCTLGDTQTKAPNIRIEHVALARNTFRLREGPIHIMKPVGTGAKFEIRA